MISCLIHAISFSLSPFLPSHSVVEGCQRKHALNAKRLSNKQRVTWLESLKVRLRGNHHFKMATSCRGYAIDWKSVRIVLNWAAPLKFVELSITIKISNKAFSLLQNLFCSRRPEGRGDHWIATFFPLSTQNEWPKCGGRTRKAT